MTRPLDRNAQLPELGRIDREAGEFWVANPFEMPSQGYNLSAHGQNRTSGNVDGRAFIAASFATPAPIDADSRAAIAADFDRDGRPDLLVGSVGGGPLRLFLNRFPDGGARVRIALIGEQSNRPAIGARVELRVGGRRIVRDRFAANGSVGQGPPELLIGLGNVTSIEELVVRWPGGSSQRFSELPVDRTLTIVEGRDEPRVTALDAG